MPGVQTGYIGDEKAGYILGSYVYRTAWRVAGKVGGSRPVSLVGSPHGHDECFFSFGQIGLELPPPPLFESFHGRHFYLRNSSIWKVQLEKELTSIDMTEDRYYELASRGKWVFFFFTAPLARK